nr:hypothetical protein [Tanacetum cinerariifolium]
QQLEVEGKGYENVPLYYYITDNIQIQFGREEFCLVTGLRFTVKNLADYNDPELPIPFRRQVFPSCYDGEHITGYTALEIIQDEVFNRLHAEDAVSLCCLGILQLVLLGVEAKCRFPDWMLRRWSKLYATQPTTEIDKKAYSISGYTLAFKTWILKSFRVMATKYYNRYNCYPRVAAWKKKKGKIMGSMVHDFFHSATPYWQPAFPSHPGTSNWQSLVPFDMGNPNLQPPIERHRDAAGFFNQNILNRGKREHCPSFYKRSPYTEQPPTTVLPKQRGNKNKNNVMKANLSHLDLGNAFDDENEGGFDVKENSKKEEIRSKPDKNGKRGEAEKSLKQLQ